MTAPAEAGAQLLAAVLRACLPEIDEPPERLLVVTAARAPRTGPGGGPVVRFLVRTSGDELAVEADEVLAAGDEVAPRGARAVQRRLQVALQPLGPSGSGPVGREAREDPLVDVVVALAARSPADLALQVWSPASGWCTVRAADLLTALTELSAEVAAPRARPPQPAQPPRAPSHDVDPEPVAVDLDRPEPSPPCSWDADRDRWPHQRLPLGIRADGTRVFSEPFESLVVASGAPRSRKTSGVCIPAIATHEGPVLVLSARLDCLQATLSARSRRGPVAVFNPSGIPSGVEEARYDLLGSCARTWADARRLAEHLVDVPARDGLKDGDFWFSRAAVWVAPAIFAAAVSGYGIDDVLRWAETEEEYEVRALLAAIPGEDGARAMRSFDSIVQLEERVRSSIMATVTAALAVFQQPVVSGAIGEGFDDNFLVAADGGAPTLYAIAPSTEQAVTRPVMRLVLDRTVRAAVAHHLQTGLPARLLVVIDEAANVGSVGALHELITMAAGCGVQLVVVFHGYSQIQQVYGDRAAETIVDHVPNLVFLRGGSRSAAALLEQLVPGVERGEGLRRLRSIPAGYGIFVREGREPEMLRLLAAWSDADLAACL